MQLFPVTIKLDTGPLHMRVAFVSENGKSSTLCVIDDSAHVLKGRELVKPNFLLHRLRSSKSCIVDTIFR
jgi:hypothetical protein